MTDKKTCAQLVRSRLKSRMEDLHVIWAAYCVGDRGYDEVKELHERRTALLEKFPKKPRKGSEAREEYDNEMASIDAEVYGLDGDAEFLYEHFEDAESLGGHDAFYDYGLCIDYVGWDEKNEYGDFIRWQLSWGGPSDEFQFYITCDEHLRYVEYRYMDWFDGAGVTVRGEDEKLLKEIFENFKECGTISNIMEKWREDNDVPVGSCRDS